jgi:hypothetical protein
METPPDLVAWFVFVATAMILVCLAIVTYWAERSMRMCARLIDTIRTMGLAASNPLMAAKLEQQRLRRQAAPQRPRGASLAEIASHQSIKARERHAQNRAAHPTPPGPITMRYVSPDDDLLPAQHDAEPDKPTETPVGPTTQTVNRKD